MGRHRITADAAFDMLSAQSQVTNRRLREIAADIVEEVQPTHPD